jgi:hypothetical protein
MEKFIPRKSILALMVAMLSLTWASLAAAGGIAGVRYYGYDWLDGFNGVSVDAGLNDITNMPNTGTSGSKTNMNIVHTIANLNSAACANQRCAVSISAGSNPVWLDICPNQTTNAQCMATGSWSNIWTIVGQIANATNRPAAIYFVDEPFNAQALWDNGAYVAWQYPSYVCTLRQAMAANNINIPVFTILASSSASTPSMINEIRNQMPVSGCPSSTSSRLDWVGIDDYTWTCADQIFSAFNALSPANNSQYPKWIIVPPTNQSISPSFSNDATLRVHIQPYWDVLTLHPDAPIIGVMNFRFDPSVITTSNFPTTAALLSLMGNSLTK